MPAYTVAPLLRTSLDSYTTPPHCSSCSPCLGAPLIIVSREFYFYPLNKVTTITAVAITNNTIPNDIKISIKSNPSTNTYIPIIINTINTTAATNVE
jgi:hypothetical protein